MLFVTNNINFKKRHNIKKNVLKILDLLVIHNEIQFISNYILFKTNLVRQNNFQ